MKKIFLRNLLAVAIILLGSVFINNVHADVLEDYGSNFSSVTVSPMNQRISLVPGEVYEGQIMVSNMNASRYDLDYSVKVGSYVQAMDDTGKDYGGVDIIARSSYNQMVDWITVNQKSGTVAPNESDIVTFTINVPEDAPAGGQYATLVVSNDTDGVGDAGGNVSIQNNITIASILYADVAGNTRTTGEILSNSMPTFLFDGPLVAESAVKNTGNVHTDAKFTLQVWPLFSDEEICTNEENPDESLILPDTERYHTQTCDLPLFGIFRAKQVVEIFNEVSAIEKTVFICPIWLMFIIAFIIIAIIIWLVIYLKNRKKS